LNQFPIESTIEIHIFLTLYFQKEVDKNDLKLTHPSKMLGFVCLGGTGGGFFDFAALIAFRA